MTLFTLANLYGVVARGSCPNESQQAGLRSQAHFQQRVQWTPTSAIGPFGSFSRMAADIVMNMVFTFVEG